jgi:hypothetical protein
MAQEKLLSNNDIGDTPCLGGGLLYFEVAFNTF